MALRNQLVRILEIFSWGLCAVFALGFVDYALYEFCRSDLPRVYRLATLPARQLGQIWQGPGQLTGALYGPADRRTPTGEPSALWRAWVTETRRSGRSTTTDTLCTMGTWNGLRLSQGTQQAPLALYGSVDDVFLIKDDAPLDSIRRGKVLTHLGEVMHGRQVPEAMVTMCGRTFPNTRQLDYYEASIPPGGAVTIAACLNPQSDPQGQVLKRCELAFTGLSAHGMAPLVRARANEAINTLRGAALAALITLSLLAGALMKLRVPAAPAPADDGKGKGDQPGKGQA